MSTARGDQAAFLARQQAAFGAPEAAGAGKFYLLPFYSLNMAPTEEVTEDDAIVGDAFPGAAVRGLQNLTGNIEVPLGMASIGWHLQGLMGTPVTSGAGPDYTHVFKMAGLPTRPMFTAGISHRGIDEHFRQAPVIYTAMQLAARKDGQNVRSRFDLLGSVEAKLGATLDASPATFATDTVPVGFQGGVYMANALVAGVTGFDMTAGYSAEADQETMNLLPTAAAFLEGKWSMTGSITARFRDTSWYDLGDSGALTDLELRFVLSATRSLILRGHNLRFERAGVPVSGGDVLNATFNFRASRPSSGDSPLTATLKNGVASYANPT